MKKLLPFFALLLIFSFIPPDKGVSKKERKYAVNLLKETANGVEKAIAGLSESQLTYQPSEKQWSVEGCIKHIAMSEQMLGGALETAMQQPADSSKRSKIQVTDEQLVQFLSDRSNKRETSEPLKPENIPFKTAAEALESFKQNRAKLMAFAKSTKEDLRNHVVELPFGSFDAYQMILLIAAHSERHAKQAEEVKASQGFPAQ